MSPLGFKAREGSALFELCGGVRDIRSLRFTSGATPLPVYIGKTLTHHAFKGNTSLFFIIAIICLKCSNHDHEQPNLYRRWRLKDLPNSGGKTRKRGQLQPILLGQILPKTA